MHVAAAWGRLGFANGDRLNYVADRTRRFRYAEFPRPFRREFAIGSGLLLERPFYRIGST
jgi:hypothetical protein